MADVTADRLAGRAATSTATRESAIAAVDALGWPLERLPHGLALLVRRAGLVTTEDLPALEGAAIAAEAEDWLDWAATQLGVEAEPVVTPLADLHATLTAFAPAVVRLGSALGDRLLLVVRRRGKALELLGPQGDTQRLSIVTLAERLAARHERPVLRSLERFTTAAALDGPRHAGLRRALARERLAATPVDGIWLLRLPPSASFIRQAKDAQIPTRLGAITLINALVYGVEILAWGIIGGSLLAGRLDFGWLGLWALLLVSMAAVRSGGSWLGTRVAIDFGRMLKARLLLGAMRMDPDAIRRSGAGHLLARAMESQAFEILALGGGLTALVAVVELGLAGLVLAAAPGGALLVGLLALWTALGIGLGAVYLRRLIAWTTCRLSLTHRLVERMIGHRTILVQEPSARRAALDTELSAYHTRSVGLDRSALPVIAGLPASWLAVAIAGLIPSFANGTTGTGELAIAIGGVLFAARALASVSESLAAAARAVIAWREIQPLFRAGAEAEPPEPYVSPRRDLAEGAPLLDAQGLGFSRPGRSIFSDLDVTIRQGEKLLLEGASGSGKSTLAALLLGLRTPERGRLLLAGTDRTALGGAWQAHVAGAPQFHENHILTGSLAFNLLMGRRWPASDSDVADARALCEELGLGDLLARMPLGLDQQVGETGWQLSHGEKSRVFMARALLQNAPLTILDESFAALDPETIARCLDCVLRRSDSLMVIAHP